MTTLEYNGLTIGEGTVYNVDSIDGLDGLNIRTAQANKTDSDGGNIFAQKYGMRNITVTGRIIEDTSSDYFDAKQALVEAFNINSGTTATFTAWDGSSKNITCKVVIAPQVRENAGENTFTDFLIVLQAEDPYWLGSLITDTIGLTEYGGATIPAIIPMSLSSGTVETAIINNTGNVEATGVFLITGEVDTPVITNQTTGDSFYLDTTIASGRTVTVQKTSAGVTAQDQFGNNYLRYLVGDIFTFAEGNNSVIFTATGNTDEESLTINFYPKFLSF